ncbi:hypothetical protein Q3G72_022093 [Acer saccharum]|nr:hypothetical protein Q3G72_022093 [Acer saccharum]
MASLPTSIMAEREDHCSFSVEVINKNLPDNRGRSHSRDPRKVFRLLNRSHDVDGSLMVRQGDKTEPNQEKMSVA